MFEQIQVGEELSQKRVLFEIALLFWFYRAPSAGAFRLQRRPLQQGIEGWAQGLAPVAQAVFDLRRNLMIDNSSDNAISFHLAKLLNKHFLGNPWDCSL